MNRVEQYGDFIARLFPETYLKADTNKRVLSRTLSFQVTDACNLACSYCYQINKGNRAMKFETARLLIDSLLMGEKGYEDYIHPSFSPGIIIDFIGGEPFLQIELIEEICDYFFKRCIELDHPWLTKHKFAICSNGVLYFDPRVQKFLSKYKDNLALSITIDGNKELHDACRIFPDGSPSYDIAIAAVKDWTSKGNFIGSKITIAPENIEYVFNATKHMMDLGYTQINANCIFEEGWNYNHASVLYNEMKKISDYLICNNLCDTYISLFSESFFKPMSEENIQNWCGGTGNMLACDPDGYLYPCIRYMESSLGNSRQPMRIGDVFNGIGKTECQQNCISCLDKITRRTQSTDKCFHCPIGEGCAWCSAHNYQVFGTADKRATFICEMHKARSLANVYYWNKYYIKNNIPQRFKMYCPKEWALKIISDDEYNMLSDLSTIN